LFVPILWAILLSGCDMDPILTLKSAMFEFDAAQSCLGSYVGLTSARVSRGLSGELPFNNAEVASITETVAAMRSVQSEIPLPINWGLIHKVKPVVDQRKKDLHEQADPVLRQCALVRLSRTNFFRRLSQGNVITDPSEMTAAAFETPALAQQCVRELKKLGTVAQVETFGSFRRKSSMTHSLAELGFEPAIQ
jgi:hypothetical protein